MPRRWHLDRSYFLHLILDPNPKERVSAPYWGMSKRMSPSVPCWATSKKICKQVLAVLGGATLITRAVRRCPRARQSVPPVEGGEDDELQPAAEQAAVALSVLGDAAVLADTRPTWADQHRMLDSVA